MNLRWWVAAILLIFPVANAYAWTPRDGQGEEKAEKSAREAFGLRGPVKSCTDEVTLPENRIMSTSYEFTPDGKMLTSRSRNPDGSEWVTTWKYDDAGRLLETSSGKTGEPADNTLYKYDDQGRLVSVTNSSNKDRTEYRYDENGRKTAILTFKPKSPEHAGTVRFSGSSWQAAESGFDVPAGGSVVIVYDENNRAVEEQVRDADDHVVNRVVRTYNAAGLVVAETPIVEDSSAALKRFPADMVSQMNDAQKQTMAALLAGMSQRTTYYAYDAQGRITLQRETGAIQSVTATTYNDHGDIGEQHSTVVSVLAAGVPLSIAENGIVTAQKFVPPAANVVTETDTHYAYQYDDYGNWTEQSLSDAKHPEAAPTVRRRTLTYY